MNGLRRWAGSSMVKKSARQVGKPSPEEEMAGTPLKRATEQADTTWSSAEDSHQSGFASSTKRSGMGKWEAKLTTMAEESVRALQTRADRTSAKTTSAQPTDAKHQGASKVTRTAGVRWCREGDLNPHNPFGSADFKSAASASFAIPARWWCVKYRMTVLVSCRR